MKIKVASFKGISKAIIEVNPLAVILGANKSGKTSLLQAAGLALAGIPIPPVGIAKASAGAFVRGGAEKGAVIVKTDDGTASIKWPAAEVETTGKPPQASDLAAGICDKNNTWILFAMNEKDRSKRLSEILDVLPTRKELIVALSDENVSERSSARIWTAIEESDWDPVHQKMKKHGATLKGQWEEVAGERYGSAKAEGWVTDDWEEALVDTSIDTLESAKVSAKEALELVIGDKAVDEAEVECLKEQGADLEAATENYARLEQTYLGADGELESAQAAFDKTLSPEAKEKHTEVTCPHCNQNSWLESDGGDYVLVEIDEDSGPSDEELAEMKDVYDGAMAEVEAKQKIVYKHRAGMDEAEKRVDAANKAVDDLTNLGDPEEVNADEAAVDGARQKVADCEARIDKFNTWTRAATIHESVQSNQKIVKVLEPGGLRKKKLTAALDGFHKRMNVLCKMAGWEDVTLDEDDLELCYGPRRFAFMSESEKYRTRAILQIAIAQIDGSQAIILDGADILDLPARKELFKLLMKSGIVAVVAMTLGSREEIPAWAGKVLNGTKGLAYWIENAVCDEPIQFE